MSKKRATKRATPAKKAAPARPVKKAAAPRRPAKPKPVTDDNPNNPDHAPTGGDVLACRRGPDETV